MNKSIHRDSQTGNKVFDQRSLGTDYPTLLPILKQGMRVLEIGCGTGAISKGIAERVGSTGHVDPLPPESMQCFYRIFLQWRGDAGMNNHIAEDLAGYFAGTGFEAIEVYPSDEVYKKGDANFLQRIGIWSSVAGLTQIVQEGYITEAERLKVMEEYEAWMITEAEGMVMKLKEVWGLVI